MNLIEIQLILELVAYVHGHQSILKEAGITFVEKENLFLTHETRVSTVIQSPIKLVLEESPYKDGTLMMVQHSLSKVIGDNNLSPWHNNSTTKAYRCVDSGFHDCPDGYSVVEFGKF